ncbi:Cytidylate kinase [Brachybacterium faecium]|nr:Cytidylate kinase [Brachybacterium faecium]
MLPVFLWRNFIAYRVKDRYHSEWINNSFTKKESEKMSGICIAIDGPAAAGKSTVAKIVANRLGYIYLDTGAMYRTLTYAALKAGIELSNETQLKMLMPKINITFSPDETNGGQRVFLNGEDVSDAIRSESVTSNVSEVAMVLAVREEMKARQLAFAENGGVVMDGRDIGTNVLPNAELKIFLLASVDERAIRRFNENKAKGYKHVPLDVLKQEIEARDHLDYTREHAPLKKAEDAIELDTTSLSIEDVSTRIFTLAQAKIND